MTMWRTVALAAPALFRPAPPALLLLTAFGLFSSPACRDSSPTTRVTPTTPSSLLPSASRGPAVPTGLRVSDTESDSIRWEWRRISGLTYEFELSGPGVSRVYEWVDFPGFDWFRATGLTPGSTYRGRVRAVEGGRRSGWTSWVSGRTESSALAVPTGLRVSETESDSIRWEWRYIGGLQYEFELSGPGVSRVYEWYDFPGTDWFRATGLTPGSTYRGRVRAVDGGRRSNWTSWVSGRTRSGSSGAPGVPTDFRVQERTSTTITWRHDLVRGATAYDYEVGIEGVGSQVFSEDYTYEPGGWLTVTISGMRPDTTYRARARAKNDHGRSNWTRWVSARTRSSSLAPAPSGAPPPGTKMNLVIEVQKDVGEGSSPRTKTRRLRPGSVR